MATEYEKLESKGISQILLDFFSASQDSYNRAHIMRIVSYVLSIKFEIFEIKDGVLSTLLNYYDGDEDDEKKA